MRLLYSKKELRDAKWRRLKAEGIVANRFTTGPQNIHPQYVEDCRNSDDGKDTGFGNTVYKTGFSNLYGLEWRP